MKKIVLTAVLACIGSAAAVAADIGARVKAPAMIEQAYNWTGFYVGGDLGAANHGASFTSNFSQLAAPLNNIQHSSLSDTSAIGGIHAGYNWQFAPNWVAGVEADWQWVHSRHSFCRQTDNTSLPCSDVGRGFATLGAATDSIATARARLGWTVDRAMVYATGGAAFTEIKSSLALSCLSAGCGNDGTPLAASANSSATKTGWVAGTGIEWMVGRDWIVRAEYQHVEFGDVVANPVSPACGGCKLTASQNLHMDIMRGGLSYKFGGPVLAKY